MRKINRLLRNDDFTKVLNKGHKVKDDSFLVACLPNDVGHLRVGISVSKKVGGAVTRVRVRRQVRAMINLLDILNQKDDLVILPRREFTDKTFQDNLQALTKALESLLDRSSK